MVWSKHDTLQKILISKIKGKDYADCFLTAKGVIRKYVPEGQTVNATFYIHVLDCLCKCIAHVRSKMWGDRKFFLLHDNTRLGAAAIIQWFLDKKGVAQMSHPEYSPD